MTKPDDKLISEIANELMKQKELAIPYFKQKTKAKLLGKPLLDYMVKNKIRRIESIELKHFKGNFYLKLENDIFG